MGLAREFGSIPHLVGRFVGALSPAGPPGDDEAWALAQLLPGEQDLWRRMSGPDRRHAVGVARDALDRLAKAGVAADREIVASALLHDVGKVVARLGTFARVLATLAAIVVGRDRLLAADGRVDRQPTWRDRLGLYLRHDQVGGELLRRAGSGPLTIAWAEEHHLDPARWSVARPVGDALKAADGD